MRRYAAPVTLLLLGILAAALLLRSDPPGAPPTAVGGGEVVVPPAAEPGPPPARSPDPVRVPSGRGEEPERRPPERSAAFFVEVQGSVCDSAGRPIAGARVAGAIGSDAATVAEARTSEEGSFRLPLPAREAPRGPTAEVGVLASATGFAPTLVHGMRPSWNRPVQAGRIALLRPGIVEGTVLLPDGEPATGADVRAIPPGAWSRLAPLLGWGGTAAQADSNGAFRLEGIPPGNLRITASRNGLSPVSREGLLVGEGKTSEGIELRFRKGSLVAGTVLDPSDRPVPGAEVRYEGAGGGEPVRGETDESGRFRLGPRPSGETGTLTAWTGSLASPEVAATAGPGEHAVRMTRRLRVAGRVLAADDRPVPGAILNLERPRDLPRGGSPAPRANQPWQSVAGTSSTSDASGAFSILLPSNGWFRVLARAEGFAPARSDWILAEEGAPSGEAILRVHPGRAIAGRVVGPGGSPVPRAEVSARGPAGSEGSTEQVEAEGGRFEISGLRPGTYRLTAWAPGFEQARRDHLVPETGEVGPVEISLRPASGIAGKVLAGGGGRPGTLAVLARATSGSTKGLAFAGADGRFEILPLPPGTYRVEARTLPLEKTSSSSWQAHATGLFPPKPGARASEVTVPDGGMAEVLLDADAASLPRLFGTVRRGGLPAPGVEIRAKGKGGTSAGFQKSARTDAEGSFELWLAVEGSFEVQARESGAPAPGASRTVEVTSGVDLEVSFDLVSGEIRGQVAADDGAPMANPHARLSWEGDPDNRAPGSSRKGESASGKFAFRGLPPGSYVLTLWADGRGVRVERIELAGGEIRDLGDIPLPKEVALAVSVRWEDGRPVEEGSVRVEDSSGRVLPSLDGSRSGTRVRGGTLRVGHLSPGIWRLRMTRPARATLEVRLAESGPTDVAWILRADQATEQDEDGG
ncbi:MAG: carboxypeptidase-like regulatory domain-containing protein [Planctomycetes bacterium]|nr:carboxypeptidase-like regulatory domain-containing protein [Planctomycetota bacterium]